MLPIDNSLDNDVYTYYQHVYYSILCYILDPNATSIENDRAEIITISNNGGNDGVSLISSQKIYHQRFSKVEFYHKMN